MLPTVFRDYTRPITNRPGSPSTKIEHKLQKAVISISTFTMCASPTTTKEMDELKIELLVMKTVFAALKRIASSELDTLPTDDQLIVQVECRPIIYNAYSLDFGHKKKTNQAWRQVAGCIKLDIATTKARWQELLDRFVEEHNTDAKSQLYNKMLWMKPHIPQLNKPEPTQVNCDKELVLFKGNEAEAASVPTVRQPDLDFMLSIKEDMKKIPQASKLKFKRDVFELLHKCAQMDTLML